MTAKADEFNKKQLASGALTPTHVTALVQHWQQTHGLVVDGMAGDRETIPSISAVTDPGVVQLPTNGSDIVVRDHMLCGYGVRRIDAHPSWYGGLLTTSPAGIVAHYTDTGPGTAVSMAKRRAERYGSDPDDRLASWHITIETDGTIVDMIPLNRCAWHAGSTTAVVVPGLGWANYRTIGIELVGYGTEFTTAQVASACRVWRTLVRTYSIERRFAMITHQSIDPSRRDDPGPVWMGQHANAVLDFAFAP